MSNHCCWRSASGFGVRIFNFHSGSFFRRVPASLEKTVCSSLPHRAASPYGGLYYDRLSTPCWRRAVFGFLESRDGTGGTNQFPFCPGKPYYACRKRLPPYRIPVGCIRCASLPRFRLAAGGLPILVGMAPMAHADSFLSC